MTPTPDAKSLIADEEVIRLRSAVMRLARDLRKTSAEEGLTPTQSSVLATVVRREEVLLSELAENEGLNPTMLSRVIGTLEDADLLIRVQDDADRRAAKVRPTHQAKKLVQRLRNRRSNELLSRIEQLDHRDVGRLLQALPALEDLARNGAPQ